MNIIQVPTYNAVINLGLQENNSTKIIEKAEVIQFIQSYQNKVLKKRNKLLSLKIYDTTIVCLGQVEPHIAIEFINYPKADLKPSDITSEAKRMTEELMIQFKQNRIVIVCTDQTIIIEQDNKLNPRIKEHKNE